MQFDREAPVIIVTVLLVGSMGEAEIEMALDQQAKTWLSLSLLPVGEGHAAPGAGW